MTAIELFFKHINMLFYSRGIFKSGHMEGGISLIDKRKRYSANNNACSAGQNFVFFSAKWVGNNAKDLSFFYALPDFLF